MVENTTLSPGARPDFFKDLMTPSKWSSLAANSYIFSAATISTDISTSPEASEPPSKQKPAKISMAQQLSNDNFALIEQEFIRKFGNAPQPPVEDWQSRLSKLRKLSDGTFAIMGQDYVAQFAKSHPEGQDPSQPDPSGKCFIQVMPLELLAQVSTYLQDDYVALTCLSLASLRLYDEVSRVKKTIHPVKRKFRKAMGITHEEPFGNYKVELSTFLKEWMGPDFVFDSFYTNRFVKASTVDLYERVEAVLDKYQRRIKYDEYYESKTTCLCRVAAHELKKRIIKTIRMPTNMCETIVKYWPEGFPRDLEEVLGKAPLRRTRAAKRLQQLQVNEPARITGSSGSA